MDTTGEPGPAPGGGVSPKKGHLSCTEERRSKREKEKRKREVESVTARGKAQDNELRSRGSGGGACPQQVAGCGQAFGRGVMASQSGALGLPVGLARLQWHGGRASQPSLTHASRAVLVGLEAPAAALVAAAAVPAVGVDADRLVPGADEGELFALICVCKQKGLGVRQWG